MRLCIALLGAIAAGFLSSHRSSLSVSIVSMTKYHTIGAQNSTDSGQCFSITDSTGDGTQYDDSVVDVIRGEFDWDEKLQGIILGASFYAYLITPTIAGRITERFGSKWVTLTAVTAPGVLLALIPVAARYNVYLLITLLAAMGLFHGCIFTSLFSLFAHWFTATERSIALAAVAAVHNFGNVVTYPLASYLCDNGFAGGWPSVFYVISAAHIPWIVMWLLCIEDTPLISNTRGFVKCSDSELKYITTHKCSFGAPKKNSKAPWLNIFTSRPLWTAVNAKLCAGWGYYLYLSKMPSYLDKVFGMPLMQNGMFNSMLSLATGITMALGGPLSALIIKRYKNRISKTNIRKLFESVALIGPAVCLLAITQIGCHSQSVVALLIVALFLYGLFTGGEFAVYGEIAPDFSGTVFGIAGTLGAIPGFVAPYAVGVILGDQPGHIDRWNIAFYITIGLYIFGALGFLLFASAEPQHWGVIHDKETPKIIKL
ncbi:uncharacterized transporter slc-17.2-like [Oppia nitens]|uniref:uncharacterized transporter slc-17.2-like n=1 Tax=Oppia nitens TaxID=1686743 RepID=UPI0023DA20C3|nr:uncharacterized transporter slc-17.2-like [Oppia nitens]